MMMPRTASQFPLRTHILLLLVILMVKTSHANAAADNINMCTTENEVTADGVNSLRLVGQTTEKRLTGALEYYCVREAEIKEEIKLLIRDIDQVAQSVKEAESSAETKLKLYVTLSSTVSKGLKQAKDVQNDIMSVRSRIFETFEEFGDVTPASVIYDDESEKLLERYIEKLLQLASFRMVLVDNYNRGLFVSSPNVLKEAYDQLMTKIERMMQGVKTTLLEKHVYLTANMITTIKEVIHDLIQTAEELQAKMKLSSSAYVEFLHHEGTAILIKSETVTKKQDKIVQTGVEIGRANFGYYSGNVTSFHSATYSMVGKYLLVTNLDNGKSVKVRIIGSGPFNGPLMDMGTAPFQAIGGSLRDGYLPNVSVKLIN